MLINQSLNFSDVYKDHICVAKLPVWVKIYQLPEYNENDPYLDNFSTGCIYLLYSKQVNLCEDRRISFYQIAYKINNQKSLNSFNYIDIDYNPHTYQEINFHYIRILRNGLILNVLDISKMHIIRREKDLENNIITGLLTCHYIIPGLKVDDIVEYAYSIKSQSPSIETEEQSINILFDSVKFLTFPTLLDNYRLVWPVNRRYFIKNPGNFLVTIINQEESIVFEIKFKYPFIIYYENDVPNSYITKKHFFSISSEKNWEGIVKLDERYYRIPIQLSKNLKNYIQILKEKKLSSYQLISEVLDFCSNEIVYTSNSEYLSANIPDDPSVVYERRYGDCKDKCFLLITLLRSLEIEAYAAIINTNMPLAINAFAPNPYLFNHVIVCVFLEGEKFWLDPTISHQGKSLKYGYKMASIQALILDDKNSELILYNCEPLENPEVLIKEDFDFRDPVKIIYSISSFYRYNLAQIIRNSYKNISHKEYCEYSLSFIQKYYPSSQVLRELSINDNYDDNEILITESYNIENIYEKYQDKNLYARTFFTEIDRCLKPFECDESYVRNAPLKISFPEYIKCTQHYIFENKIDIPKDFHLDNSFFRFSKKVRETPDGFKIDFSFITLKSQVEEEFFKQYTDDVNKVIKETYEVLPYPIPINKKSDKRKKILKNICYWLLIYTTVSVLRYLIKN